MLTELDVREAKRLWEVAGIISGNDVLDSVHKKIELFGKLEGRQIDFYQSVALAKALLAEEILAQVTVRLSRGDLSCAPGTTTEDIDEILQAHENSEALLEALFSYTVAAVDQAFRYGYYAAIEDGNLKL